MKGDRPRPFTNAATDCGMPRNAAAFPRIDAPSTISAIIEQVTTDPMTTSRSTCCDSDPWPQATSAAPSTPTAAATEHAIDDHDFRRRNQKAERAGACERADRDIPGITAAQQFVERHAADHL